MYNGEIDTINNKHMTCLWLLLLPHFVCLPFGAGQVSKRLPAVAGNKVGPENHTNDMKDTNMIHSAVKN